MKVLRLLRFIPFEASRPTSKQSGCGDEREAGLPTWPKPTTTPMNTPPFICW